MHEEKTDREPEHGSSTGSCSPRPTRLGYLEDAYDNWVTLGRPGEIKHPRDLLELLRPIQTQAAPVPDYRMTDREKLTDDQRCALVSRRVVYSPPIDVCEKALRIIDRDEADRAALAKELEEARADQELTRAGCEAQTREWKAEVARLTQALGRNGEELAEVIRQRDDAHRDIARLAAILATTQADLKAHYAAREAAEQKLAAAEREIRHRERKTAELVEKLAAAEQNFGMLTQANESITAALNAAEARCRELELRWSGEKANHDCTVADAQKAIDKLESELAQLRTENADIIRLNALAARRTHEAESELASLRARVAELPRWNTCPAEPEEDDDGPLYQGFLTDPDGTWVRWEDVEALRGPK